MAKDVKTTEEALQKLTTQLECGICFDEYKDPKVLSCFHVFCKQCLVPLAHKEEGQVILQCPNCRRTISLPPRGVSELQSAFHVNHLFEIRDAFEKAREPQQMKCEKCDMGTAATRFCKDCGQFVCHKCTEIHQMWKEFSDHQIVTLQEVLSDAARLVPLKKEKVLHCQKHPDNILKIYCETCNELICNDCTIRLHQGHTYDLISDTFPKHKHELVNQLEPVKRHLATVDQALRSFDARSKAIQDQRTAIQTDIYKKIDQLHQTLEQRRTELIGELEELTQHKLKSLAAQRDQVETVHTQLSSCLEYVEGSLKTGTQGEILTMKAPVQKQIEQIITDFRSSTLSPKEKANVILVADNHQDLNAACCKFADVKIQLVNLEKCYATGDGLKTATVGETATVTLHTRDTDGKKCPLLVDDLVTELVNCRDISTVRCQVRINGEGKYEIEYQPATRGKHRLHIRIDDNHIKGSPHAVFVTSSIQSLGTAVRSIGSLRCPLDIATNKEGEIIVSEIDAKCVSVISPEGRKLRSFGGKVETHEQFDIPRGVAVDRDDKIFVVDNAKNHIRKSSRDGSLLVSVGTFGRNPLQFCSPIGIAHNRKTDQLYVCDRLNHRIQILNRDLTFYRSFGSEGSGNGQLQCPCYAAFDSSGNVYVTDRLNHRIQVFTPNGMFLRKFGSSSSDSGVLTDPTGIAIDSSDIVYVTEYSSHRVSLFTIQGKFLKSFGSEGKAEGQFSHPCGITIDEDDFVMICDSYNNRIQIF